ncbi:hypothetical protein HDU84_009480 [Entophlyctis sp. JEL0112]|nr:hypothetical protein HDU84_009480 [Entophlyctis sp. JEL0112]
MPQPPLLMQSMLRRLGATNPAKQMPLRAHVMCASPVSLGPFMQTRTIHGLRSLGVRSFRTNSTVWAASVSRRWSNGRNSYRSEWDPQVVIYSILGLNTAVFLMWQFAISERQNGRPAWYKFMADNFFSK